MPNDHNASQSRRPHYHRGRRGGDRRQPDRRSTPGPQEQAGRDHVDVEQIMRDIRARIAKRHGIDLAPQQIRELAARRLEAILEPRHVAPSLMEQMRRAAGEPIEVPAPRSDTPPELDESALYASHRGLVRRLRRWLNPILKLFFNPTPLVETLRDLTRRSNAAAAREAELHARQAEWNALHFEILQRLVTEVSRATIETQGLAARVESLAAKVDFTERQVRSLEGPAAPTAVRPVTRPVETAGEPDRQVAGSSPGTSTPPASLDGASEGQRRRRRRRRGRRGGGPSAGDFQGSASPMSTGPAAAVDADIDGEADLEADADGDMEGPEPVSMTGPAADASDSGAAPIEPAASFPPPREPAPRAWDQLEAPAVPVAPDPASGRFETTPAPEAPAEPSPRRNEPGAPEQ